MVTDAIGQPLNVGDAVVYVTGKYNMFHHGHIDGFTPKCVRITTSRGFTTLAHSQIIKKPVV